MSSFDIGLLVVVGLVGLYMAWNIGANDVANALGTSVGSHAVTIKQAIIIAAIFEFGGAVLVGGNVTETIRQGMLNINLFEGEPMVVVYGMAGALLASGIWLQIATATGLPVSTTHSVVGGVVGFGLAAGGIEAVQWSKLGAIVGSWVVSPLLGGVLAYLTFAIIRRRILDADQPLVAMRKWAPWFVVPIFYVLVLSLFFKGLKNLNLGLGFWQTSAIALCVGLLAAIVAKASMARIQRPDDLDISSAYQLIEFRAFRYLQLITACFVAFAHGSNDVANAVGPIAAVYGVLQTGSVHAHAVVPTWMLLLGGFGIVVGLATWGYKVIATIGTKITEMTPSRGFSAEFGASLTIMLGSKLGLPISTTHVLVGAVIGVGLARGIAAINLRVLRSVVSSWLITVPFCAVLGFLLFKLSALIFL